MDFLNNRTESTVDGPFEVFFDGDCPLCKREIEMIRRKDKHSLLKLTDIAAPDFASEKHSLDVLMREIHGRYQDGRYVTGVDVFREIYDRIGFGTAVRATRWPVIRQILDLGYRIFARIRFYFAMRRMDRTSDSCEFDGSHGPQCQQKP